MEGYKTPPMRVRSGWGLLGYGADQEHEATIATMIAEGPKGTGWRAWESCNGQVYFIGPISKYGPIKIGWADKLARRLAELQIGSPVPLIVYAALPARRADEHDLHRAYEDAWVHGEWFRPDPGLVWIIAMLQQDAGAWLQQRHPMRALLEESAKVQGSSAKLGRLVVGAGMERPPGALRR